MMNRLPSDSIVPPTEGDRERLALWLAEWEADRILQKESVPETAESTNPDPTPEMTETAELKAGQVRLLFPDHASTRARLRYVAILEISPDGPCLMAPFSRFSEPALPGEMQTQLDDFLLRVLCPWNAHPLPADRARRSWLVDHLSEEDVCAGRELHAAIEAGDSTPAGIADRTGPPVHHPLDPRKEYMIGERQWISALAGPGRERDTIRFPDAFARQDPDRLRKAAEDRDPYHPDPEDDQ